MATGFNWGVKYGCQHYTRGCELLAPCCNKFYSCRICHDEKEDHTLNRRNVKKIKCLMCLEIQRVQERCEFCFGKFGKYFCNICNLFDDEEKQQFHCMKCGICRVGGRQNYFHCDKCDFCLNKTFENNHNCVEKASRISCPVCVEDIHTSRDCLHVPKCTHLLHKKCYDGLVGAGMKLCPICQQPF